MNDIALPKLPRHWFSSRARAKWADAQSQDLTVLLNAAIAENQIVSVSGARDAHILNPVFRSYEFLWCAKNVGDDRHYTCGGMLLPQELAYC